MRMTLAILATCFFLGWGLARVVEEVRFNQDCGGYLERAANANTTQLAEKEMARALEYIERNKLTEGYTSLLWKTPDEDLGFWYSNLSASLVELRDVRPDASQLERSNVLMKLRETLTNTGEHGTELTAPSGISVYPHNMAYCAWAVAAILLMAILWPIALYDM